MTVTKKDAGAALLLRQMSERIIRLEHEIACVSRNQNSLSTQTPFVKEQMAKARHEGFKDGYATGRRLLYNELINWMLAARDGEKQ